MNGYDIAILTVGFLLGAAPAYAYVDPGTGGMLIQLVTGGVAGVIILLRLYWRRLKAVFGLERPDSGPVERPDDTSMPAPGARR